MTPRVPTSWLLTGSNAWLGPRGFAPSGIAVGDRLTLDVRPGAAGALDAPDGSLGGLVSPRGAAFDDSGNAYLFGPAGCPPWIKRLGIASTCFVRLPALGTVPGTDNPGSAPRQFADPSNIAVAGPFLYVADAGNHRFQVFTTDSLTLRFVWGPWDGESHDVAPEDPAAWQPADVTASGGRAYLLDRKYGRVYVHRPGDDVPALLVNSGKPDHWDRLAVDRNGQVYLFALAAGNFEAAEFDPTGLPISGPPPATPGETGRFADRFDPPPIAPDDHGRLSVSGHPNLLFDRSGEPTTRPPGESPGPPTIETAGTWIAGPLDSHMDRCPWDTIELGLDALPPGSTASVATLTADASLDPKTVAALPDDLWSLSESVTGMPPVPRRKPIDLSKPFVGLVQSTEGRFLWVKVSLGGDGYGSPGVTSIRARYPRRSWVGYLPAVYSEDDRSRRSLERYLAVLQATAGGIDRTIGAIRRLFDPKAVPAGPFLDYLAAWLGVSLEEDWPDAQKRRHLVAAPGLLRGRGTVKGLRDALRVNLADAAGDAALAAYPGLPAIVEGFRLRRGLALGGAGRAELGRDEPAGPVRVAGGEPIWGPSMSGRFVLGGYDRLGEGRLFTEGAPDRDLYDAYAHKFRVVVPSAWVRDPSVARTLRRTIATESPASAAGTLVTVGARLRVGMQSTVGLDAIVAAPAGARLGRPDDRALGLDVQLPPRSPRSDLWIDPGARVGVDTNLT